MATEPVITWSALGIDPGLTGGVAALGHSGGREAVFVRPMPVRKTGKGSKMTVDAAALHRLLRELLGHPVHNHLATPPIGSAAYHLAKPLVAVERVSAMRKGEQGPKQGVSSTFTFGMGYGKVLGVVEVLGLPLVEPMPQAWQKLVLKGRSGGKEASVAYCLSRYPDVSLLPTPKSKKPSHGLADALCLAEYALRQGVRKLHEEGPDA